MIKKVTISPGCISCGLCEFVAPDVFQVKEYSQVKPDAELQKHEQEIKLAQQGCPVQVIDVEE